MSTKPKKEEPELRDLDYTEQELQGDIDEGEMEDWEDEE